MTTAHTPGPWTVSCMRLTTAPALGRDTRLLEVGPSEERLALVYFDMKTGLGQADARLVAAAPEMLAALDDLTAWTGALAIAGSASPEAWAMLEEIQERAAIAMAKAKGENV